MVRGIFSFFIGAGFLVLTACVGNVTSIKGVFATPFGVELTFAPIADGFNIGIVNRSGLSDFDYLFITATNGTERIERNISVEDFVTNGFVFRGLNNASSYQFEIEGSLSSDGTRQTLAIIFGWDENEEDHQRRGGIRPGMNADGDGQADSVDEDDDNDGVKDGAELDGCELNPDCDEDGVQDSLDRCLVGVQNWQSNLQTDRDGDGCRDVDEDIDDDDDGLIEIATAAQLDAVRYQLNGTGQRLSDGRVLKTTGCGGGSCNGYELIANISLAAYSEEEGWQPLGHDTNNSAFGCEGASFKGVFAGNGFVISNLSINRPNQDCVGLFGSLASDSEIINLTLHAEEVIGGSQTSALVGSGSSARIVFSSVVVGRLSGDFNVGGLMGDGSSARVVSSSVVAGQVNGSGDLGGLVGRGSFAQVVSSLVVAGQVSGTGSSIGALLGSGTNARIVSSSAVARQVSGLVRVGGLAGSITGARIVSSSVVVSQISGSSNIGGLVGAFQLMSRADYSYVVLGRSNVNMLTGTDGFAISSYWDSETSGITNEFVGTPQTTDELRTPIDYTGIYSTWGDRVDIDGNLDGEDITRWCDTDASGSIEATEQTDANRIWDFGTANQYPAIRCLPIPPAEWRSWWFLNGTGEPELNQTRLDALLPSYADDESGGGSAKPFEVELTFAPIVDGFNISITNRPSLSNFDYLFIIATNGTERVERNISVEDLVTKGFIFDSLNNALAYQFEVEGNLSSNGTKQALTIAFGWEENEEDHQRRGGIRPGVNTDGDGQADSVDEDDDNDRVKDSDEVAGCELNPDCDGDTITDDAEETGCVMNADCDSDTIRDDAEEAGCILKADCDGDTITDDAEEAGCISRADCDGDTIRDDAEEAGCILKADCDGDMITDDAEELGCILKADCDNDRIGDSIDNCPLIANPQQRNTDGAEDGGDACDPDDDNDNVLDSEDVDVDGDGLIEIATAAQLDAVRHQLNGTGQRLSDGGALKTSGCDGGSCNGYELIANISLAAYGGGEGWQPLGHDTNNSASGCNGASFSGIFAGNGFVISNLSINRPNQDCVGLFGGLASDSEINDLTLHAEEVIGRDVIGALVGSGSSARIVSSSVVVRRVSGDFNVGSLVGSGSSARIVSSSVVAGQVNGSFGVGGLMGTGPFARIISSSVVAGQVNGSGNIGGLVGSGSSIRVVSSSVVAGVVRGDETVIGGLVGSGTSSRIVSSSAVVSQVSGKNNIGGLVGDFQFMSRADYSYVVLGRSNVDMLVGRSSGSAAFSSYWDSETSDIDSGFIGTPRTTDELRTPTDYTGIYATWGERVNIDGDLDVEDITRWCDTDASNSIEVAEQTDANRIWDFGTPSQYPAIRCLPIPPAEWHSWWFLNRTGEPELNQTRLDALLPP